MSMNSGLNREVYFEIVEPIGVITTYATGWKKELNLVSWNGGQPKYDIRDWDPSHEHMSRGVTLHEKEMRHMFELMKRRGKTQHCRRNETAAPFTIENMAAEGSKTMEVRDDTEFEEMDSLPMEDEEQSVMEAAAEAKM